MSRKMSGNRDFSAKILVIGFHDLYNRTQRGEKVKHQTLNQKRTGCKSDLH